MIVHSSAAGGNSDPLAALAAAHVRECTALHERIDALTDRVLLLEAALHHICDVLGIDTHTLPDPTARREGMA